MQLVIRSGNLRLILLTVHKEKGRSCQGPEPTGQWFRMKNESKVRNTFIAFYFIY